MDALAQRDFDLLIIGGGATGAGIALEAAHRGLQVALVERDDFASGTSSRSTKLLHGGVRYLEQAVKRLDRSQFHLVREALHERAVLLRIAPHLSRPLALLTPLYRAWQVPYYWIGLKLYDLLAGRANLSPSRFLPAAEAKLRFPMLRRDGLVGAVQYFDGQFDDARMNLALVLTAAEHGAVVANHVEVAGLHQEDGRLRGATLRDRLSGRELPVRARVVVNATGPFIDEIRHMDDPDAEAMLHLSSGVHVVLDGRFSPPDAGLLIPKTDDGRVLFLLPWQGKTLVGTTDQPASLARDPQATEAEIDYILEHVARYFDLPVERADVQAAWSGLRPLVAQPRRERTASVSRDHTILRSDSGLISVAGGKWTTYRRMAMDALEQAIEAGGLSPSAPSSSDRLTLYGGEGFVPQRPWDADGLPTDVADHLHQAYGDRAPLVASLARAGQDRRLVEGYPYVEAEVSYAIDHELACTPEDVLNRRMRLGFLDEEAAAAALPLVRQMFGRRIGSDG